MFPRRIGFGWECRSQETPLYPPLSGGQGQVSTPQNRTESGKKGAKRKISLKLNDPASGQ